MTLDEMHEYAKAHPGGYKVLRQDEFDALDAYYVKHKPSHMGPRGSSHNMYLYFKCIFVRSGLTHGEWLMEKMREKQTK